MSILSDRAWKTKYRSGRDLLLRDFYEPALETAVRYDRSTGFFSARVLTLASRGVEGLVRNQGHWRLIVGCQLRQNEVDAIARGLDPQQAVALRLADMPLAPEDEEEHLAVELLAWLVARGTLEVRFAIPCDDARRPLADAGMFHEKAGIVEDKTGDRLAWNGSINETPHGWQVNWESFHVFTSWSGPDGEARVSAEEQSFRELWVNAAPHCLVVDVPQAVRDHLLQFLPVNDSLPRRLATGSPFDREETRPEPPGAEELDLRPIVWGLIQHGATLADGGERVGEATSVVTPWPHQVRAFERMYRSWPPRLLIADEVGLGKTIEAGLLLRQAWMAGKLRRAMILAPKSVVGQWQLELREKFNLDWPVYDGESLRWAPSRARIDDLERRVAADTWHQEPFVLVSSHLLRREARARALIEQAEPWDLVILDEAHHARRKGGGLTKDRAPNRLLDLMQKLRPKSAGLLLLTATPMQVHPKEVWDLLELLRMPEGWTDDAFVRFFEQAALPNPSVEQFEALSALFRAAEATYGSLDDALASRYVAGGSRLATRKILTALRDRAQTERRRLDGEKRKAALRIMQAASPVARSISRHTRELLRRYYREGRISTPVPERRVEDVFVALTPGERVVYDAVEDYISRTYNAANPDQRNAVGFVMTIYRRRLASSFHALTETLARRLADLGRPERLPDVSDEDVEDDELVRGDVLAEQIDQEDEYRLAGEVEERGAISALVDLARQLPPDSKADVLLAQLGRLRDEGREQVMVFTQFTDTVDALRDRIVAAGFRVLCYSGRGGERLNTAGRWTPLTREDAKRAFARGDADTLLCTDAAAEGLNFQFCGAVVNYDMPWNPMRVEQRIGRIDRLGQRFPEIRVINLHYEDTVETDVYRALRARIKLFEQFVGRLQPILAALPQAISSAVLASGPKEERAQRAADQVQEEVARAEAAPFDLDALTASEFDETPRPAPAYDLAFLEAVLRRPDWLPHGVSVRALGGPGEYEYSQPGMSESLRVTTRAAYYDEHSDSVALWSPGSPLFPVCDDAAPIEEVVEALPRLRAAVRALA